MKYRERVTFNQAGEIFDHSIDYLRHVGDLLDALHGDEPGQRVKMLLDSYLLEHRSLLAAIERYADDADARLLNSYTQYAVELPAELSGPEQPLTTLTLTQWLQALNQHLVDMFRELSETTRSADLRTAFEALTRQIESHERKLSKEYQRFEDL